MLVVDGQCVAELVVGGPVAIEAAACRSLDNDAEVVEIVGASAACAGGTSVAGELEVAGRVEVLVTGAGEIEGHDTRHISAQLGNIGQTHYETAKSEGWIHARVNSRQRPRGGRTRGSEDVFDGITADGTELTHAA